MNKDQNPKADSHAVSSSCSNSKQANGSHLDEYVTRKLTKSEKDNAAIFEIIKELELFQDQNGLPMAILPACGEPPPGLELRERCVLLRSDEFIDFLRTRAQQVSGKIASKAVYQNVIETAIAQVNESGKRRKVHLGEAMVNGEIWIDPDGRCNSFYVVRDGKWLRKKGGSQAPLFMTSRQIQGLPQAKKTDRPLIELIQELSPGLSADASLKVALFLVTSYLPLGAKPHLLIQGPQGSGKTTLALHIKKLVDASASKQLQLPDKESDVVVQAMRNKVLLYDNLSVISDPMSDVLAKLSTGSEIMVRTLYTNHEASTWCGKRSVIMTAINNPITKSDLWQRTIHIEVEARQEHYIPESQMQALWEARSGELLGAILKCVSQVMDFHKHQAEAKFRLGDFAIASKLLAPILGVSVEQVETVMPSDELPSRAKSQGKTGDVYLYAFLDMICRSEPSMSWTGTASELIEAIAESGMLSESSLSNRKIVGKVEDFVTQHPDLGIEVKRTRKGQARLITIGYNSFCAEQEASRRSKAA